MHTRLVAYCPNRLLPEILQRQTQPTNGLCTRDVHRGLSGVPLLLFLSEGRQLALAVLVDGLALDGLWLRFSSRSLRH